MQKYFYELSIWGSQGEKPEVNHIERRLPMMGDIESQVFGKHDEEYYGPMGLLDVVEMRYTVIAGSAEEAVQIAKAHCHWYSNGVPKLVELPA